MTSIYKLQAKYENYVALTTTRKTAIRYAKALESFFSRFKDKENPEDFTRLDIQDYVIYRRKEGIANTTINYELVVLKGFWKWLMDMEVVPFNPVTVKRLKQTTQSVPEALSESDQERIFEAATHFKDPKYLLLAALALNTGLRAETLARLEKSDIDFETGVLEVPGSKMKAGRNHCIPLLPYILELLASMPEGRIFEGFGKDGPGLSYRFNRILRRAGISLRGLRLGRRTFATTLLRKGADLKIVQDLLGHKNIKTTSLYLAGADPSRTLEAIELLPQPFQAKTPPVEAEGASEESDEHPV